MKYRLLFLIAALLPNLAICQKGIFVEASATYSPFKSSSIEEKGLGYYPVDFENLNGYNFGVGYFLELSQRSSLGFFVKGSRIRARYNLKLIHPLDEYDPEIFNGYNYYGTDFNLYALDGQFSYLLNLNKLSLQMGIGLNFFCRFDEINTYTDENDFYSVSWWRISDPNPDPSASLTLENDDKDLFLFWNDRITLNLGVNYMLDSKVALTFSMSDNPFTKSYFRETNISGHTERAGFNDPIVTYPLNETYFKKRMTMASLGIRYYFGAKSNESYP